MILWKGNALKEQPLKKDLLQPYDDAAQRNIDTVQSGLNRTRKTRGRSRCREGRGQIIRMTS
jgi:hypothetical protein